MTPQTHTHTHAHTHLEELAHGLVIQAITAVKDDTLDGEGLRQIFSGLCLACTGRARWRSTQVHVNGPNQGAIAPVATIACLWTQVLYARLYAHKCDERFALRQ